MNYVEKVDGGYRVSGTRVSLDSIVGRYQEGLSAEGIAECFPVLSLDQVYGTIAFYIANRTEIDAYMRASAQLSLERQEESRHRNADLIARIQRARHESQIPG